MALNTASPRDQVRTLKYVKWDGKYANNEKPFQLYVDLPLDVPEFECGNVKFGFTRIQGKDMLRRFTILHSE
jgi:hypothetical protein